MEKLEILKGLGNWTSLVPMFVALSIIVRALWLRDKLGSKWGAKNARMSWPKRIIAMDLLRRFIPLLPLTGIFGTIWALVKTLAFMAEQSKKMNISDALPDVLARFAPALFSTAVGVVGAVICIIIVEFGLNHLEADETD